MQYLTYEEYKEIGGEADLTAFYKYIYRVCAFIDNNTFCRLQKVFSVSQTVKACIRDCVDFMYANNINGKAITSKSQSAGGVSESESYTTKTADDLNDEMLNIVRDYLSSELDDDGVPLMYRGASNASHRDAPREPIKIKVNLKYGLNEIEIPR